MTNKWLFKTSLVFLIVALTLTLTGQAFATVNTKVLTAGRAIATWPLGIPAGEKRPVVVFLPGWGGVGAKNASVSAQNMNLVNEGYVTLAVGFDDTGGWTSNIEVKTAQGLGKLCADASIPANCNAIVLDGESYGGIQNDLVIKYLRSNGYAGGAGSTGKALGFVSEDAGYVPPGDWPGGVFIRTGLADTASYSVAMIQNLGDATFPVDICDDWGNCGARILSNAHWARGDTNVFSICPPGGGHGSRGFANWNAWGISAVKTIIHITGGIPTFTGYTRPTLPVSNACVNTKVVAAGYLHTCGVKTGGTVACWGLNDNGQSTPPAGTFTEVSAGGWYTCGLKTNGTVACWGDNTYGQTTPPAGTFTEVSAGWSHACGLKTNWTVACWGNDGNGQKTPPAGAFTEVSAGGYHTCGLKTNGTVACWGRNIEGQSTPPVDTFTEVSAGYLHTCGLKTDGTVACWGWNADGQTAPPAGTFTEVSAGGYHTCGVKPDGTVACWGYNDDGEATPTAGTFTEVSAGYFHTCGVRTDGTVACWGLNSDGQSPALAISPATLPAGIAGTSYSQTITASGGTSPYTFYKISGSLPTGLTLKTGGTLSGTPGSAGDFSFKVQVVDKSNISGAKTYTLTVKANTPPTIGTLTPSVLVSAPDIAQKFTAIYHDADGYGNIKQAYLRVKTAANGIYLRYDRTTNKLYLYNDAGTATIGSCKPGGAGTLTNKQGSINCAATTVAGLGNNLTIKWNITPNAAFASVTKKNLYMFVRDMSGLTAGWTDKGDWTIKQ